MIWLYGVSSLPAACSYEWCPDLLLVLTIRHPKFHIRFFKEYVLNLKNYLLGSQWYICVNHLVFPKKKIRRSNVVKIDLPSSRTTALCWGSVLWRLGSIHNKVYYQTSLDEAALELVMYYSLLMYSTKGSRKPQSIQKTETYYHYFKSLDPLRDIWVWRINWCIALRL